MHSVCVKMRGQESVLSFHSLGPGHWTLVIRLGLSQCSYPTKPFHLAQGSTLCYALFLYDLFNSNSDPNKAAILNPLSIMMKSRPSHTEKAGHGHAINPLGFELKASLFHQQGRFGISLGDLLKCSGQVENSHWVDRRCGSPSVLHNTGNLTF